MNTHDIYQIESINPETISRVAYRLWEQEGRPTGRDMEFWLQAEALLHNTAEPPSSETHGFSRTPAAAQAPAPVDPMPLNPEGHYRDVKNPLSVTPNTDSGRPTKSARRRGLGKAKSQP